jgi:hypothetical protein
MNDTVVINLVKYLILTWCIYICGLWGELICVRWSAGFWWKRNPSFFRRRRVTRFFVWRKRGFILLGIKCSDWLANAVEEAMEAQRKEDFARTFRDEVGVLKVRMGSNKVGCFLEVVVFVEGGRKGVIRLLKGRGGWGWQRFVDELRLLVAQFVEKVLPVVPAVNTGEVGSSPSCAPRMKSSVMEAPSPDCSLVVLRSLANDFLAKVRAEVDWVAGLKGRSVE